MNRPTDNQPDQADGSTDHTGYWTRELRGFLPGLRLPYDYAAAGAGPLGRLDFAIPLPVAAAEPAGGAGAALALATIAAFAVVLSRQSGQPSLLLGVIGGPLPGDPPADEAAPLPLPLILPPSLTFRGLMGRIERLLAAARDHQPYDPDRLLAALSLGGGADAAGLFQASWAWRPQPPQADPAGAGSGLHLSLRPGAALEGALAYQADRWHPDSVRRLAAQFIRVLAAGSAAPDTPIFDLPLMDEAALADWLALGSGPAAPIDERCVHQLVEAQAARAPEALAVAQGMQRLSYAQLNHQAELIALRLLEIGLRPDERVGVAMDRAPALIAALLGVLKAGGAYVPLDPSYPDERLSFIARDSGLRLLLTQAGLGLGFLPPGVTALAVDEILASPPPARRPALPRVGPEQTAYVIYTSGSTGQPKGVLVPHRALVNYLETAISAFQLAPGDRVLQFTSISFDASAEEMFATLASGAALVLRTDWMLGSPRLFLQTCQEWGVTVLDLPTAYWHLVATALADDNLALPEQVRLTVIGGEAAQPSRLRAWRQRAWRSRLLNAYGPTETTIASTLGALEEPREPGAPGVTLGRPIANTTVYILDARQQPAPPGVFGEIHIGGAGLARGYLGRPGLTAERFVPDPFSGGAGARMYRTGDEGRFRPDGALEFRSRLDDQIKLHGYRIEVAEIEALLRQQPHVREALVLARPDERQQTVLAAYVVPKAQPERLPLVAPCAVTANGETFALETRDLSLEGMRLARVPAALFAGQQVEVRLASPAGGQELALAGTVAWRRRLEAGIRFTGGAAAQPELARAVAALADTVFASPQHQQRHLQPLQRQLALRLPAYMVPTRWQLLRELPLLPNGKLDRRALLLPKAPEQPAAAPAGDSPLLAGLGALWQEALGRPVDAASHFFELGGQSLQALQLLALIRERLGLEAPLRLLFEAPTLGAFAQAIADLRRQDAAALPLLRREQGAPAPLSFAQRRLWFFDQLRPGNTAYTIALTLRIAGPLEPAGVEQSLRELVRRHEILRTTFADQGGEPAQIIHPPRPVPLPLADLSGTPPGEQEALSAGLLESEAQQPFDLLAGPLLRCVLVKLAPERHHLLVTVHHSVFDGTSVAIFVDELFALYQAWRGSPPGSAPAALPELPVQYADFARWQRQALSGERLEAQRRYWVARLAGAPMLLSLRTDFVRPRQPSLRGAVHRFLLPAAALAALRAWSRREGHTLFMTLMAAFQALLHRHSGQTEILVGTAAANRPHHATAGLIGFFVNTLVFSARIDEGLSFRQLLAQVHETALQAFEHQDLPFDHVVEALGQQGNLSYHPVVQAMFILQPPLEAERERAGLRIAADELDPQQARLDLALELEERPDGLAGRITYSADLFEPQTIARLAGHFQAVLAGALGDPDLPIDRLPLSGERELRLLLGDWATAPAAYDYRRTIHELIDDQARRTPDAIAVASAGARLTYAELAGRANQLARHLRSLGVGRGSFAAIACENSAEGLVGLLGTLKSGAAYVPLDVTAPPARLAFMLEDTGAAAVLTKQEWHGRFAGYAGPVLCLDRDWPAIAAQPAGPLGGGAGPDDLAYVIYTSGSSGQPKGVMVPHAGLANFALASRHIHRFPPGARVLGMPPLSFDAAGEAIFPPLLGGASVVLHPAPATLNAQALIDFCAAFGVTAIVSSTALWNQWCNELLELDPDPGVLGVTQLILGGDSPSAASVKAWLELFPQTELFANHYGPTEATICATHCVATEALLRARDLGPLPIGGPLPNVEVYVLDAALRPAPAGAPGMLYIGGAGLARGYLGQPALTAQRFVPHPFADRPGARLYATGDLARFRNDGALEFLGRADDQLKVRGYRIEPGEIEAALRQHPQVGDACLLPQTAAAGDTRLIAYVASAAAEPLPAQLRDWLRSRLPDYMIPAAFVQMEALPLTSNGKVNRRLLPPYVGAPAETPFMLPRNTIEETLARIWGEVLDVPSVGIDQNFFELGGHSLLALRLVQRVQEAYPIKIPVQRLFEAATVAEFARCVVSALNGQPLETPIDLLAEAALGPEIRPPDAGPTPGASPRAALLTGATGFLGAYLLVELLAQTDADIHCLVRAASPEEARRRIMQNLARYGLERRAEPARIIPLVGDLAAPLLGLGPDGFDRLAGEIDAIYHNGGAVNFIYPYSRLKAANVDGTREVLRLACAATTKPVHFISTLAVYAPEDYLSRPLRESDPPDDPAGILHGYEQSKWVADRMLRTAQERGLPVTIYRPARITGDSATGASNLDDFMIRLLVGCAQLGKAPAVMDAMDMLPVDYLSAAIVRFSLLAEAPGRALHFFNAPAIPFGQVLDWLAGRGYPLERVPFEDWRAELTASQQPAGARAGGENALAPLTPLFWLQTFDGRPPLFDSRATFAALRRLGMPPPAADEPLFARYLEFLRSAGLLPPIGQR